MEHLWGAGSGGSAQQNDVRTLWEEAFQLWSAAEGASLILSHTMY